jgi:hypothetical protein
MKRMGDALGNAFSRARNLAASRRRRIATICFLASLAIFPASCKHVAPLDTKPLDTAGMSFDAIQKLKSLDITPAEIAELAKARSAGLSDRGCAEAVEIAHGRNKPFDAGDAIAGLIQVGMGEDTILELAKLNQLGLGAGELQAMRLAGLSDAIVLEVARHRAGGKPVLAGASLARMKNTGMRESTLLELARRGVPDSRADAILAMRRHRATDKEILRRFSGS